MVVARVIGNDATIAFGQTGSFLELNVMLPGDRGRAARVDHAARGVGAQLPGALVEGVTATERGPQLVEQGLMLATALAPVIGYDEAAKLAKEALASAGRSASSPSSAAWTPADLDRAPRPGGDDRARSGRRTGRGRPGWSSPADRYNPRDGRPPVPGIAPRPSRPG